MHQLAQGIDDTEVEEYGGVKSVSRETTFEKDTDEAGVIVSTIDDLAGEVHESLVQEQLRFPSRKTGYEQSQYSTHAARRNTASVKFA